MNQNVNNQNRGNNKKFNFNKWSFILGTSIAVVGAIATAVTVPEVRCSIGLKSETCVVQKQEVELITLTETGNPLALVRIQVISQGAPEVTQTDNNGYGKVNIPSKGDVNVILSKGGYPTQRFLINLGNDQSTTRTIWLSPSGKPEVKSSLPSPLTSVASTPTPTSPTSTPTLPPSTSQVVDDNITWELKSCVRKQQNVSCNFLLSSSEDTRYLIYFNLIKIVDSEGNSYSPNHVQIANENNPAKIFYTDIVKGSHYKTVIDFDPVPTSVSEIILFQFNSKVKFRNIAINP